MATMTVYTSDRLGNVDFTTNGVSATSAGNDAMPNDGSTLLLIQNNDSGSLTLTIAVQGTYDGLAVSNRTVTIAAGHAKVLGPFDPNKYNDTNGRVVFTYSATPVAKLMAVKSGAI